MATKDVPTLRRPDDDGDHARLGRLREIPDVFGDPETYRRLVDVLGAMTASGPRADEQYHEQLRAVRDDGRLMELLPATVEALDEDAYHERWALTQLAVDLESEGYARFLVDTLRRPVPDERAEDPGHGLSTVTEEVILRTTALEGLARLGRQGVDVGGPILETVEQAPYLAMRQAAFAAALDTGRDEIVERARAVLAARGEEWIADLKRIPVEEAPQADRKQIPRAVRRPRTKAPTPFDEN